MARGALLLLFRGWDKCSRAARSPFFVGVFAAARTSELYNARARIRRGALRRFYARDDEDDGALARRGQCAAGLHPEKRPEKLSGVRAVRAHATAGDGAEN